MSVQQVVFFDASGLDTLYFFDLAYYIFVS